MARPKDKEETILSAGIMVFMDKGFSNTSIQDISGAAGIAKGTIYEYFKSKDELFIESIKYEKRQHDELFKERVFNQGKFLDKINTMLDLIMRSEATEHVKWMNSVMVNDFAGLKPQSKIEFKELMASLRQGGLDIWSNILLHGVQEGIISEIDIDFAAACVFCLTSAYNFHISEMSDVQYDEEKARLLDFIFCGIGYKEDKMP